MPYKPLRDWEGGIAVRIYKSGDLPAENSGEISVYHIVR